MKLLNDFLKEYVTPAVKPAGFKKKRTTYRLEASSGDAAFLEFSPVRIDPDSIVFYATCSMVPEPYWQWLNRQYMIAGVPALHPSGAIASFSVIPPSLAAHAPEATGLARARWAFNDETRAISGQILGDLLRPEVVPRVQHLLVRENLLEAIRSPEKPSIRRCEALKAEIVLMVDEYPRREINRLLSELDDSTPLKEQFAQWVDRRLSER